VFWNPFLGVSRQREPDKIQDDVKIVKKKKEKGVKIG